MNTRVLLILWLGFILMAEFKANQGLYYKPYYQFRRTPAVVQQKYTKFKKLKQPKSAPLYIAISSGFKIRLDKILIQKWKTLGIIHLLTPSGIHLAIVLSLFSLLRIRFRFLEILLAGAIFLQGGFYSMERIFMIRLFKNFKCKNSLACGILLALVVGHYQKSPLSFIYSLIFLGIFYSQTKRKLTALTIAHLIICWFSGTHFYLLAPVFNFILTAIFSILFPVFLVSFWLPFSAIHELVLYILNQYIWLTEESYALLETTLSFEPSMFLLLLVSFFLIRNKIGIITVLCFFAFGLK